MDEDLKLYIPLGVKPEAELFTGFGKKQLFQSIVGSLVMGGIAALAWLFTGNVTTTVILALAGIFGSVMMTTKDQSNLSVVDQVQNLIRFLRRQKIYPYYEQDRAESAQTRKDVSIHGLEETEHCATRALDEEWEERVVDIQNRKYAWKALEQLFTVGALTEVQKRRFRLHVFQGLSTRQIGRMEGTSHQAVAKSLNLAIAKLKKYFAAQG